MELEDSIERGRTLFESLVYTLNMTAMQQLGKVDDLLQTKEKDLIGAKDTYDLLVVLKEKTQGNLSDEETRFIDKIIKNVAKYMDKIVFTEVDSKNVEKE